MPKWQTVASLETKKISNSNDQITKGGALRRRFGVRASGVLAFERAWLCFGICSLDFGVCLGFGNWNLEFSTQAGRVVIQSVTQFCRWLLWRVVVGCALAALVLAAWMWRLQTRDAAASASGDFQAKRAELLAGLAEQRSQAVAGAEDARKRADDLQAEARAQEQDASDAARAVEAHKALESSWQRWFGDREQQELNDKLLAEAEKKQAGANAKAVALKGELTSAAVGQERANIEVARVDARIQALEKTSSKWVYYVNVVWERGQLVALAIVVFWIVWPPLRRAFFYYFVAPFIVRRKALRLAAAAKDAQRKQIATGEAARTVMIALEAGEVLRVKRELVESADGGLERRVGRGLGTSGAWFPVAKILCGLARLAELKAGKAEKEGGAGDAEERRVILRGMGKWKGAGPDLRKRRAELMVVDVPRGASLALRPRYLAGAVLAGDARLAVRSHWRFFNWHAWVTGQFRFLEFAGPCRLIVAGQRGVRAERIEEREDGLRPVARADAWAVMGFDAALRYRPARAESFWKYCTGARPLYDDLFIGTGVWLAQVTPLGEGRYDTGRMRQFFAARWRGLQKIFGS